MMNYGKKGKLNLINWIIDFLSNRSQGNNDEGCVYDWGSVPSGIPQGTKLGHWQFSYDYNDLVVENARLWKYVDDTFISKKLM